MAESLPPSDRPPAHWARRPLVFGAAAIGASIAGGWFAIRATHRTEPARGGEGIAEVRTYRDIQWEDLVPRNWDPTKRYRQADGSLLSDADPKAQAMLEDLRAVWDNAPTVRALDQAWIRLPGYVVPLDVVQGALTEFLLVPYFGACIHTPPPPANQIVHVLPEKPVTGFSAMDTVWVSGQLVTSRDGSPMGSSGYRLAARVVAPYRIRPA